MVRARWLAGLWMVLGCDDRARPPTLSVMDAGDDLSRPDVRAERSGGLDVSPVDPCGPAPCGAVERCGPAREDGGVASGNGVDDNCNGVVDEGCPCALGELRPCFPGAPDRRGVGICRDGTARCSELGAWGVCAGATVPGMETCNNLDDDCDGAVDEGLQGCASSLRCPASVGTAPLREYALDGRTIDPGARSYAWTVQCPEGVDPCPAVARPDDPVLRVMPVRSGVYRVRLGLVRADGSVAECRFPLYVQGRGLRVELDWDRKGGIDSSGTDMDLHVGIIDRRRRAGRTWFSQDDCYFLTCKAPGAVVVWGDGDGDMRFAPTPSAEGCAGAPPPWGGFWREAGRCWNPRLDVDDIVCDPRVRDPRNETFCFPENTNVDAAPEGVTFRVLVNFYRDHGTCTDDDPRNDVTHPVLAIHCGGIERAALGSVEDGLVPMRCADNRGIGSANWSWLAADVRFETNGCAVQDCRVTALRARDGLYQLCSGVAEDRDVCQDERGRVFVRRTGARPVDSELAESP